MEMPETKPLWRRFAPLVLLFAGLAATVWLAAQAGFGIDTLATNYQVLADWVARDPLSASLIALFWSTPWPRRSPFPPHGY